VGAVVLGQFDAARTIYGVDRVAEQVEAQVVIANGLEVMGDRLRRERDQGRAKGPQGGAMLPERLQLNRAVRTPSAVAVTTFSQLESVA